MNFRTKISKTEEGKHTIRGHDLIELIERHSFADAIFLLWRGNLPSENEKKLLETILVAAVENGIESPSIFVPRISASTGNSMHTALAAGILAMGENHGGAGEQAARVLSSGKSAKEIVEEFFAAGKFIPGFGHKVYKEEDPRAAAIYKKAKALEFSCKYFELAYEIEREIESRKSKKVPLNIDGAIAATMLELGFDWRLGKAMFIIPRLVGAAAHILEEYEQKNSYYRLEEDDFQCEE